MAFCDVLIVGGGAAGMALSAWLAKRGRSVILAEREEQLGGVLNQCAHSGFGQVVFGREMTGTEYAKEYIRRLEAICSEKPSLLRILTKTAVLGIDPDRKAMLSSEEGLFTVSFRKLVLATGCRERTMNSLPVSGSRPSGIMTCGMAQKFINVHHLSLKGPAVILGTGDIGQIMARQLIQSGQKVICMIEQNEKPGGRLKNRNECIKAFRIPVLTDSTIVRIYGEERIRAVRVRNLKTGKEQVIDCALLLTAIGLIPETELEEELQEKIRRENPEREEEKSPSWLIKTGNCRFVHDIVDSVTLEAEQTGASLFPEEESGW